jgi:hypothetical protein
MMLPQQWEGVAQERMRDFEKEMHYRKLLAQLPAEPARWQRWTGSLMVATGTWLMRLGERMNRRECQESVSVTG